MSQAYQLYSKYRPFFKHLMPVARPILRAIWYLNRPRAIRTYLKTHQTRKLHLGAEFNFLEGWLNTDLYPKSSQFVFLDVTKNFPFEDQTFDYIFSEHMIEHLAYAEGVFMLHECYRVMKPNGTIRLATPDLEVIIGLYSPKKSELEHKYIKHVTDRFLGEINDYREAFVINNAFRGWGHQFIYDHATLQKVLQEAGFIDVTCYVSGESNDPNLRGIEFHHKVVENEEMNQFETMVLEAKRPA